MVVMAMGAAYAQDTVTILDVRQIEKYFVPSHWPVFPNDFDTFNGNYIGWVSDLHENHNQMTARAFRMMTEESLEVYGIAAAARSGNYMYDDGYAPVTDDTSTRYAYSWLMLFEAEPDSLRPLADTAYTYVHVRQTPQYYLKFDVCNQFVFCDSPRFLLPMYERYFPKPVTVTDSFYVGTIVRRDHWVNSLSDIGFPAVLFSNDDDYTAVLRVKLEYVIDEYGIPEQEINRWETWLGMGHFHTVMFPILTPQPDTTGGGGGGTGIGQTSLVDRYTSVSPNPASNTVRIVSSFGISAIEVFDASGRSVFRTEAHGLAGTLDVAAWPRGTYLLHITTNSGMAVKKLILQ